MTPLTPPPPACSTAQRIGAARVPGYSQYGAFIDSTFLQYHVAANGGPRWSLPPLPCLPLLPCLPAMSGGAPRR